MTPLALSAGRKSVTVEPSSTSMNLVRSDPYGAQLRPDKG